MTTPTPTVPKAVRPLWRRVLKWTGRGLVALAVTAALGWAIWDYTATRKLREEIARIKTAGEPVTFAELSAHQGEVNEARDAGPYYTAAIALVRDKDQDVLGTLDQIANKQPIPPASVERVRKYLEDNRLALEMLDRGSAMPECDYDTGIQYGIAVCLPRMNSARCLININSARTRLLALQGHGEQAIESLIASLRFLRFSERKPIIIVHLVRLGAAAVASNDVCWILQHGRPPAPALENLSKTLLDAEHLIDLQRSLIGERVYQLEMMRSLISGTGRLEAPDANHSTIPESRAWPYSGLASPLGRTMAINVLRTTNGFISAAGHNWPELLDVTQQVGRQSAANYGVFAQVLAPSLERTALTTGRSLAMIRSARVAVMIERYQQAHGKLPDTLVELATTDSPLPADPFTGKSLIYRKARDGYLIYSVGDQRQDHGGKMLNGVNGKPSDWGFHIRHDNEAR